MSLNTPLDKRKKAADGMESLRPRRTAAANTLSDVLRILMTLGDDRAVKATYILGRQVHGDPAATATITPAKPVASS